MKRILFVNLFFCALLHAFCISPLVAGVPQLINFQGKLTDDDFNPLTGSYSITFGLWSHQTSSDSAFCQWTETHSSVTVTDGLFNVLLGSVKTDTLGAVFADNDTLYLEKTVGAETLSPRVEVGSLGYAMRARMVKGKRATDNVFPPFGPVGIGTTDPDPHACLHIVTTTDGDDWREKILLERPEETVSININLEDAWPKIEGTNPDVWWRIGVSDDFDLPHFAMWERKGNPMIFGTGGPPAAAERMRITSGGKVGIGTKSPDSQLEVSGFADQTIPVLHLVEGDSQTGDLLRVDTFEEVPRFVVKQGGNVGIGTASPDQELHIHRSNDWVDVRVESSLSSFIDFGTGEDGHFVFGYGNYSIYFGTNGSEKMRITPDGKVGINTSNPNTKLAVAGLTGTSSYNNVRVNTDTGDFYYESSSNRYKDNIRELGTDFQRILEAEPMSYTDKTSGQDEIGYIAEDFDQLGLDELVIYDGKNRPNGLRYDRISLYLVEIIKDQQQEIASLKERLEKDQQQEIASLKKRLELVEKR